MAGLHQHPDAGIQEASNTAKFLTLSDPLAGASTKTSAATGMRPMH
jgi:hypothetical protein